MMNVELVIRILGYIVYTALWSPIIVLGIVIIPLVYVAMILRAGGSVKCAAKKVKNDLIAGIQHDINFIKTGVWE